MSSLPTVKYLALDVIGTIFDWHGPVVSALKAHASVHPETLGIRSEGFWDQFAYEWRAEFFAYLDKLASDHKLLPMNTIYQDTLNVLLERHQIKEWDSIEQSDLIKSWSMMEAFADASLGIDTIRRKYTVISLTNGSMRNTIDAAKRNNIQTDGVITSDIIGTFKPNQAVYKTALKALQCEHTPEEVAMVAAHAFDLEAAGKEGFKTIYIVRPTEDIGLDPERIKKFDLVINEGGFGELARRLGAV